MWKAFISYYKPHKNLFIFDMCCAIIVSVSELFYPVITRNMINIYIPNRQMQLLLVWAIVLLGIYIMKAVLNYCMQYYGHVVGVRMQADMREKVFKHLQRLPFTYFDNHKTGVIMSRMINDLMDVSELAHHGPEDLFLSILTLVGSFILMANMNLWLTLIIFAFLPVLVWFAIKKRMRMNEAFTKTRVEVAEVNATLENSIAGVRVTKAFVNTEQELKKFNKNNNAFRKAREFSYKVMGEFFSGMNFIIDLLNVVVFVAGGIFTYYGWINAGEFVAYLLYVNVFLVPVRKLVQFVEQYQSGMTGFKRFQELMEVEEEQDRETARPLEKVEGNIRFEDVSFTYEDGSEVLSGVELEIQKGTTVALVGPSGGGKTTLCHLIPRFYQIDSGKITIDGTDIRDITLDSLRGHIGIVQQDVFLFTGTIYDNIAYGGWQDGHEVTKEEVVEAAKKANLHEFVMSLENGYDTYIGERGIKLSGGQKQRVSIARVFLKNPPILILDEATSALDNVTEIMIQKALEDLSRDRTTIVVAHRLSTVQNADEIVVLTDEGIAERGTHSQLLERGGIYANLYQVSQTIE